MARKSTKQQGRRRNGEGSVVWDESRQKWRATITAPDGSRPLKRFDDVTDADNWLAEMRTSIAKNTFVPRSDMTLGQWLLEWLSTYLKSRSLREKTALRYKQTAAHILTGIGDLKLQETDAYVTIQDFLNNLTMSQSSKNKAYKMLVSTYNKAVALNILNRSPMLNVEPVPATIADNEEDIEIFSYFEMRRILGKLSIPKIPGTKNINTFYKHYPIVLFAFTTGCRLGEILGLRWDAVDFKAKTIRVTNNLQDINGKLKNCPPKTKAGRRAIALSSELVKELEKIRDSKPHLVDGYVFLSRSGAPFWPCNFERTWKRILAYCEVDYKKFHTLRHTYATEMLAANVPILEVTRLLGHSKASHTLNLYGHKIPGYNYELAGKLDQVFGA